MYIYTLYMVYCTFYSVCCMLYTYLLIWSLYPDISTYRIPSETQHERAQLSPANWSTRCRKCWRPMLADFCVWCGNSGVNWLGLPMKNGGFTGIWWIFGWNWWFGYTVMDFFKPSFGVGMMNDSSFDHFNTKNHAQPSNLGIRIFGQNQMIYIN